MKKSFKKLGEYLLVIPKTIWILIRDIIGGALMLLLGSLAIFSIGFSIYLMYGFKGVDRYFKNLTSGK